MNNLNTSIHNAMQSGYLKDFCTKLATASQQPLDTTTMVVIGVASSVIQRVYSVSYEWGSPLPIGMYVLASQPSGVGKSYVIGLATNPIYAAYKAAESQHKDTIETNKLLGKKEEDNPPSPLFIGHYSDITPEALETKLPKSNNIFSLISSEQGLVNTITGITYGQQGRKNNSELWLKGFSGEYHSSARVTRDGFAGVVAGAIVSYTQPSLIESILDQSDGTGAVERCIILNEPSLIGKRKFVDADRVHINPKSDVFYDAYCRRITAISEAAIAANAIYEDLPSLSLHPKSWALINNYRQNTLEPKLTGDGALATGTMRGFCCKFDQHVMKLSATLHVMSSNNISMIVGKDCVKSAMDMIIAYIAKYADDITGDNGTVGLEAQKSQMIKYLSKKRTMTRSQFDRDNRKAKPWSEIDRTLDKKAIGRAIDETINALLAEGIIAIDQRIMPDGSAVIKQYILAN